MLSERSTAQQPAPRRPLIVATNREPYKLTRTESGKASIEQTTGGLVSALIPAVEAAGGSWFAWNPESILKESDFQLAHELRLIPVTADEVSGYYRGFANGALWPLCHYALDRCQFRCSDWQAYAAVNDRFAASLCTQANADSLIWVHDYHLMLVPDLIRKRGGHRGGIAYFHHIPFPAPDVFRALPWHREVTAGLLGADLIGFHTEGYAQNFLQACSSLPDTTVDFEARTCRREGRTIFVREFPIGIDTKEFDDLAQDSEIRLHAKDIRKGIGVDKLILGVDRLDYSKGIQQRLEAIDLLLTKQPELIGVTSLLQIAVPSRTKVPEYAAFKKELDEAAGRINGKYSRNGWQPIHCVYKSVPRRELVAHYLAADVALVTPLRDGMNLVAKEFCAARADDDGVLVLSEFAGVAECLGNSALVVNPFDIENFAASIATALTMPAAEISARMRASRVAVRRYDINDWLEDFLCTAERATRPVELTS